MSCNIRFYSLNNLVETIKIFFNLSSNILRYKMIVSSRVMTSPYFNLVIISLQQNLQVIFKKLFKLFYKHFDKRISAH